MCDPDPRRAMDSRRAADLDWTEAPAENFTGRVWFGHHHPPGDDADLNVLGVLFEPGARTDWHSHPAGQVIYVLEGRALVATERGERIVAGPGDAVHAPAGEMHWHGADGSAPMMHLSITHGGPTEWSPRKVGEDEYQA